jgi:pyridoxamine 5'-phosphate oxidase family protein
LSRFTEEELKYLRSQRLGRLATVNQRGAPQVVPVTFRYNPELDTIDIGGFRMGKTQKFRNIIRNSMASLVIDDVLPPWKPRMLEIRAHAEALPDGGQTVSPDFSPELLRLTPTRIIFMDTTTGRKSARNIVATVLK